MQTFLEKCLHGMETFFTFVGVKRKNDMKKRDLKVGQVVVFDNKQCFVATKGGKRCLKIAMPMGWYHFEPGDWNDVKPV